MKYFNQFTGFSALLLAGTMGFAACSSDDEVADVNPSYDGSSVKAQFSINIPANATQSRMTSGEAQEVTNAFLGMKNIKLFPLILTGTEEVKDKKPVGTTLGNIDATGDNSWTRPSLHAKVYNDVQFDLGVNHAVFYGEAIHGTTEMSLTPDYTKSNFDGITFSLVSSGSTDDDKQSKLLAILNGVDAALTTNEKRGDVEIQGIKTLHEAYRAQTGSALSPTYKVIAGSSAKIKAMMTDLYNSCETGKTNNAEYATEYGNIQNEIKTYFTENSGSLEYRSDYPSDYPTGIPNGAVAVQFTGSAFAYTISDINSGSNFNMTTADKYRKPSSLYYFADTDIRTLNTEWLKNNNNWTSVNNWSDVVSAYEATGATSVTPSTQSIILKDQVQYGVAALKTIVKLADANTTNVLSDSRNKTHQVVVNGDSKLKMTGVLVGGQPSSVKWNFVPASAGNYVVYDGVYHDIDTDNVGVGIAEKDASQALIPNYTLLLQNQDPSATAEKVKVAIEFENDMEDFYGHDDMLISKGTKFYLIADLDPTGKTTDNLKCVFQKDYMTSATFTVTSLKNAYSVVPDLRSPKLEFGLSVDLSWQAGMNFEVNIGGDN
ncbi:MAG: hypothetical protein PUE17_02635 [Bacteroidales bacterium]|nr:hypothetical protein [Bacteroidales bacterium]